MNQKIFCEIVGWSLFLICAVLFIISGFKNHDILLSVGSMLFLIACVIFLIPLIKSK